VKKSEKLFKRARRLIPGGVNSPVRAYEPYPFFTSKAKGSKIYDVDGNVYIDYCMAYGPLILGHSNPAVIKAVNQQLERGSIYGTPTETEVELAKLVTDTVPCMDMVRFVNSGTEATMHAIRAARGYSGKSKIIKFEGCYHGAHDYVLVKAGSGAATFGAPTSLGIPEDTVKNTIVLPFNNIESLEKTVDQNKDDVAAVIVEPVLGNAGVIPPKNGYLKEIRRITEENGIVLIFDEVITGFRLALGGAQEYYHVTPDLATFGKILGGGFPIGAFGGKREIMELISPLGKIYQAGTFSGNPVSMTAGLITLKTLVKQRSDVYKRLKSMTEKIMKGLLDTLRTSNIQAQVNSVESMFQIFFTDKPVVDYTTAMKADKTKFMHYWRELLRQGIFIPPSQFETCFLSSTHTKEDLAKTLKALDCSLRSLQ